MFLGTYNPRLDEKGRLILPAKFRAELADGVVVTRTQERALAMYPQAAFEEMMAAAAQAPSTIKPVRDYQRMIAAGASLEVPDRQGRIVIPQVLRNYAGLDRDVVVIGAMNRAEIWDVELWQRYSAESEEAFAGLDQEVLSSLGQ